jgi:hypothetical protein
MQNLKELRAELKKIGAGIKIKTYSEFRYMKYIWQGEPVEGNVFTPGQLDNLRPLINFVNDHKEEIVKIALAEGLTGSRKFMKRG